MRCRLFISCSILALLLIYVHADSNGYVLASAGHSQVAAAGFRAVAIDGTGSEDPQFRDYDGEDGDWAEPMHQQEAHKAAAAQSSYFPSSTTACSTKRLSSSKAYLSQILFSSSLRLISYRLCHLLILSIQLFSAHTQQNVQGETRDFLQFLRRIKYDHRQCPENDGESVDIEVSIVVSNIRAVSEVTMDYALELFYREAWVDSRLDYDKQLFKNKTEIALHESYTNFLWHPDTFMPNAIASKNPQKQSISHRSLLRLKEKGHVLYSRRISIVAECPMDLTLFPFDSQVCKLGIESYGYTADQVRYKWSKNNIEALVLKKIRLPDFQIKEAYVTSQTESYATGDYSRLYVCFVFTRSSGFCFLQLIIPSTAVVITSWVSLWMESETEFQDMISIILAITFLIFSYNEMMPRVSYIKAMDVYLGVCFMIVFLSLIKLAFVKYMRQKLRITRDTSLVAGLLPVMRVASNGLAPDANMNGGGNLSPTSVLSFENSSRTATRLNDYTAVPIGDPQPPKHVVEVFGNGYKHKRLAKFVPRLELTHKGMRRCHWISQMMFFFGFVIFCMFYFLIYPNLHMAPVDPACLKENAEWFADVY
ncbi:hypothetical protein L596_001496 [Steinernema carpocapsae]|uniref:Neurotransmitter-gated ion-channel ligand-binding domain-containing protein n=1 Tax=Steinernema carpocapsae TaxID=34508 RepID=A0A4U8UL85_STECR|nr:hypothetical protein L596_001496 [Steinernema carpocapsae]